MKSLEDYIQEAAKGGSTRSGIVLGIRMSLLALKELQLETPPHDRSLITIVEIDRCLPDAVQLLTGCRLGNRTLKFKDYGKMAATFVDMEKNHAIRIAAKESVNQRLLASNPADEEEALRGGYQSLPDEDLFTWQWVRIALPVEERPGYRGPRVVCSRCGEGISFGREVARCGSLLCRACAGQPYFESV